MPRYARRSPTCALARRRPRALKWTPPSSRPSSSSLTYKILWTVLLWAWCLPSPTAALAFNDKLTSLAPLAGSTAAPEAQPVATNPLVMELEKEEHLCSGEPCAPLPAATDSLVRALEEEYRFVGVPCAPPSGQAALPATTTAAPHRNPLERKLEGRDNDDEGLFRTDTRIVVIPKGPSKSPSKEPYKSYIRAWTIDTATQPAHEGATQLPTMKEMLIPAIVGAPSFPGAWYLAGDGVAPTATTLSVGHTTAMTTVTTTATTTETAVVTQLRVATLVARENDGGSEERLEEQEPRTRLPCMEANHDMRPHHANCMPWRAPSRGGQPARTHEQATAQGPSPTI